MADPALLAGVTVVEVGDGIAGSVAATTLGALGATVYKLVRSDRRHLEHQPRIGDRSAIVTVLDRDKQLVEGEAPLALFRTADIVIVDAVDGPQSAYGDRVTVTITPFGADGPDSGRPGGELVAAASGGLLATIEPEGGGRPVSPPGFVALRSVGSVAALAALHGLDRHRLESSPVAVDVSAQEAVVFTGSLPECAHVIFNCPGRAGSGRYVAPSGVFPCQDGHVRIAAVENHQWAGMVTVLGAPAWTDGLDDRPARVEHADAINANVAAWTAQRDKSTCAELLQGHGVPATAVNMPAELLTSPQLQHRGSVQQVDLEGRAATVLGPPWRTRLAGPTSDGRQGVDGLRVVELTHVLAGPIVGALLGGMGANVIRLEDLERLDIYRRSGPFADGAAGPERGAYFAVANHSKASVAAGDDIAQVAGALASNADVLIENVGQSRLDRLGLDPDRAADAGLLTVRVSGFGADGPASSYRVYANNVQAYGGLAWLTRDHDGRLARFGSVLADPLSSVIAATVIAAWALGPERARGGVVDLAMVEVVAGCIAEYVAAASAGDAAEPPLGNDLAPFVPHGVYRAADERFVAVAVQSDGEWGALVEALADPTLAQDAWATVDGRRTAKDAIDAVLDELLRDRDAPEVAASLTAVGVRAAAVARGQDLVTDAHLEARAFFPAVAHPELPDARIVGLPWRFAGQGAIPLRGAPMLGSTDLAEALEALRDR